jgi:hypothetical protein
MEKPKKSMDEQKENTMRAYAAGPVIIRLRRALEG